MTIGLSTFSEAGHQSDDAVRVQSLSVLQNFVANPRFAGTCALRECLSWGLNRLPETQMFYFDPEAGPLIAAQVEIAGALISELVREICRIMRSAEHVIIIFQHQNAMMR